MISATQSNHPLAGVDTAVKSALEVACTQLKAAQMRITQPRIAILETLARQTGPISIEDLHRTLAGHACDLVTVYRCLAAFEGIRLVHRTYNYGGTCLYELTLDAQPKHFHVICRECGRIENFDSFPVDGIERLLQQRGFTQLTPVVEFFGICPACAAQPPSRAVTPIAGEGPSV